MSVWITFVNDNVLVTSTRKECVEFIKKMEKYGEVKLTQVKDKSRYGLLENEYLIKKSDDYWDGA